LCCAQTVKKTIPALLPLFVYFDWRHDGHGRAMTLDNELVAVPQNVLEHLPNPRLISKALTRFSIARSFRASNQLAHSLILHNLRRLRNSSLPCILSPSPKITPAQCAGAARGVLPGRWGTVLESLPIPTSPKRRACAMIGSDD
jgi:hypothetical protein